MEDSRVVGWRFCVAVMLVTMGAALAGAWGRPPPEAFLALMGTEGLEREGGVRVRYRLDGRVHQREVSPLAEEAVPELLELLGQEVAMYRVKEGDLAKVIAARTGAPSTPDVEMPAEADASGGAGAAPGVFMDLERWRGPAGEQHRGFYLAGPSREALERTVAVAESAAWRLPEGSKIGYQQNAAAADPDAPGPDAPGPGLWRTYELEATPILDQRSFAGARVQLNRSTNLPSVLVELDEAGAERLCRETEAMQGGKLAVAIGDEVSTAPVIMGAICGGRFEITVGSEAGRSLEAKAAALAAALQRHAMTPPGSIMLGHEYVQARRPAGALLLLLQLLSAATAALGVGLLTALMLKIARPSWRTATSPPAPLAPVGSPAAAEAGAAAGGFPWRRLAITLLAPAALVLGQLVPMPGLRADSPLTGAVSDQLFVGIGALGVRPVLTAFVLVELVALAVPRLRWRRHDARGRIALGKATAAVAVLLALMMAHLTAGNLLRSELLDRGVAPTLVVVASLSAAALLLAVIAGVVREHGLGNGYGALLAGELGLLLWTGHAGEAASAGPGWLTVLPALAVAAITVCVLRWQVAGPGRVALQAPSTGDAPLSAASGLLTLSALLALTGLGGLLAVGPGAAIYDLTFFVMGSGWRVLAMLALIPLFTWLFARPQLLRAPAQRAGLLAPTSRDTWRAAALAAYWIAMVGLVPLIFAPELALPGLGSVAVMLGTAAILDAVAEAGARRRHPQLAPAAVLHQIQRASIVEEVLAREGIVCHLRARHLRALLAFFGPYVPVEVLVPAAQAERARALLDEVLREPHLPSSTSTVSSPSTAGSASSSISTILPSSTMK